jgi:hypothetical protein
MKTEIDFITEIDNALKCNLSSLMFNKQVQFSTVKMVISNADNNGTINTVKCLLGTKRAGSYTISENSLVYMDLERNKIFEGNTNDLDSFVFGITKHIENLALLMQISNN